MADSSWVASFSEWNLTNPETLGVSYTEALDAMTLAQTRARLAEEKLATAHCLALIIWRGWACSAKYGYRQQLRRARKWERLRSMRRAWRGWQKLRIHLRVDMGHGLVVFEKRAADVMRVDTKKVPRTCKLISFLRRPKCVDVSTDQHWQIEANRCWPGGRAPIARWNTVFLDKNGVLTIGDTFSRQHLQHQLATVLENMGCGVKLHS